MASGVGQIIEASDYATIKATADLVFGKSSGQSGYGQAVTSPNVTPGVAATAAQWLALRTDMVKARQHQTGVSVGTSNVTDGMNLLVPTSGDTITNELRNQFQLFANTITTNKQLVAASQLSMPLRSQAHLLVTGRLITCVISLMQAALFALVQAVQAELQLLKIFRGLLYYQKWVLW